MPPRKRFDVPRGRGAGGLGLGGSALRRRHRAADRVAGQHHERVAPVHLAHDRRGEVRGAGEALAEHGSARVDDEDVEALAGLLPARQPRAHRDGHVGRAVVEDGVRGLLRGDVVGRPGPGCEPSGARSARRRRGRRRLRGGGRGRCVRPGGDRLVAVGQRVLHGEIARRDEVVGVERAPVAAAAGEVVAARRQAGRPVEAEHLHVDVERPHPRGPAGIVRERVDEAAQARGRLDDLRVREHDAPRPALRDGEDLQLEAAAALPLEERRIAPGAGHPDDLLLGPGRLRGRVLDDAAPDGGALVAVDEGAVDQLAVDLERQLLDLGAGQEREAEDALQLLVGVVGERLVHLGARRHVGDAHLDRVPGETHRALLLHRLAGPPGAQLAEAAELRGVDVLRLAVAPLHHVGERARARHHRLGVAREHRLLAGADVDRLARVRLHAHGAAGDLDGRAVVARGDRERGGEHLDLPAGEGEARRGALDVLDVRDHGAALEARRAVLPAIELDLGGAIDRQLRAVVEREPGARAGVGAQGGTRAHDGAAGDRGAWVGGCRRVAHLEAARLVGRRARDRSDLAGPGRVDRRAVRRASALQVEADGGRRRDRADGADQERGTAEHRDLAARGCGRCRGDELHAGRAVGGRRGVLDGRARLHRLRAMVRDRRHALRRGGRGRRGRRIRVEQRLGGGERDRRGSLLVRGPGVVRGVQECLGALVVIDLGRLRGGERVEEGRGRVAARLDRAVDHDVRGGQRDGVRRRRGPGRGGPRGLEPAQQGVHEVGRRPEVGPGLAHARRRGGRLVLEIAARVAPGHVIVEPRRRRPVEQIAQRILGLAAHLRRAHRLTPPPDRP